MPQASAKQAHAALAGPGAGDGGLGGRGGGRRSAIPGLGDVKPPGSRLRQVSPVLGISAASSPARGSGPGRAPAAAAAAAAATAAAAPELRPSCVECPRLLAGGPRPGAQGGLEG